LLQERGGKMWERVEKQLTDYPSQRKVVRFLLENGFNVEDGKVFCNQVYVPTTSIARALHVDRRTVVNAVSTIEKNQMLGHIFIHIKNAGLSVDKSAKCLGLQVMEIIVSDMSFKRMLAMAASIIAESGIDIRQAIAQGPKLTSEPKLTLVTHDEIPAELIDKLLKVKGVVKVSIF
jgi:hypothetical protein